MSQFVRRIRDRASAAGFDAACTEAVGRLLTVLAASKPNGRILELGTGVGVGTAHLLAGMTESATLTTVESDASLAAVAREEIADPRVDWVVNDGGRWLDAQVSAARTYDLIFADTWPGKYTHLEQCLSLVAPGGLYLVDDLTPQPEWPTDHAAAVDGLVSELAGLAGWQCCHLDIASGVMLCARIE